MPLVSYDGNLQIEFMFNRNTKYLEKAINGTKAECNVQVCMTNKLKKVSFLTQVSFATDHNTCGILI